VIELLDKSIVPERFVQVSNALDPRKLNDIGANVSNPVIGRPGIKSGAPQITKALPPILVILEGKDATSLWQRTNAPPAIDVRFWVL